MCSDDNTSLVTNQLWWFGKIYKYKPRARVYNYDIQWFNDAPCQQRLKLEDYVDDNAAPTVAAGRWCYLKRAASPAQAGRSSDHTSEDDEADRATSRRRLNVFWEDELGV
mmetsp:Transcript_8911/g.36807  ORF Transcript_8911/g.36807 Transcript_8911/m.36807 type:complete len:110 (-) Transcript_8911:269-598(-)